MEIELLPIREILSRWLKAGAPQYPQRHRGEYDELRHAQVPGVYHASSVHQCLRKAVYERREVKSEGELPLGLFEAGRNVERSIFNALSWFYGPENVKNDINVEVEVLGDDGKPLFRIVGESDPVLFQDGKPLRVNEVKSSAAGANASPTKMHYGQLSIYQKLINVEHGSRVDGAILMASRDDLEAPKEDFVVKDESKLYEEAVIYFRELHGYLQRGDLPPAKPTEPWECMPGGGKSKNHALGITEHSEGKCPFWQRCVADQGWESGVWKLKSGPRKGKEEVRWWLVGTKPQEPAKEVPDASG